jgi:hypothetical protein
MRCTTAKALKHIVFCILTEFGANEDERNTRSVMLRQDTLLPDAWNLLTST